MKDFGESEVSAGAHEEKIAPQILEKHPPVFLDKTPDHQQIRAILGKNEVIKFGAPGTMEGTITKPDDMLPPIFHVKIADKAHDIFFHKKAGSNTVYSLSFGRGTKDKHNNNNVVAVADSSNPTDAAMGISRNHMQLEVDSNSRIVTIKGKPSNRTYFKIIDSKPIVPEGILSFEDDGPIFI